MCTHGFSLLELSIVLVIIGLLAGGITVGADMVKAAELRSLTTQLTQYQSAANTFRDKFMAIPGDMKNATSFWGAEATCPSTVQSAKTATCNGDGNGALAWNNESFAFWQHLSNAGLIEGSFWGVTGSGSVYDHVCGSNSPQTKIGNSCIRAIGGGTVASSDLAFFPGDYGANFLQVGTQTIGSWPTGQFITPEDMWNVDVKMDDGEPGYGHIISAENYATCHTAPWTGGAGADPAVADYNVTLKVPACILLFVRPF